MINIEYNPLSPGNALIILHSYQALPGFLPHFSQPVLVVRIQVQHNTSLEQTISAFNQLATHHIAGLNTVTLPHTFTEQPLLALLARGTLGLLRNAGLTAINEAALSFVSPHQVDLLLPAAGQEYNATLIALTAISQLINALSADQIGDAALLNLSHTKASIRRMAPPGQNSKHFLQAAQNTGLPWRKICDQVYQFGWGARARCLDSSFSDQTPIIATRLARDKLQTARLLRMAGLPTPHHALAVNAAEAVKIAEQLGYPVVVKPADLDAGQGVAAGLTSAEAVTQAFERARGLSQQVLVEKHIDGNDYRLQVYHDEVYWVAHRMPASITGDGISTVGQLIEITNQLRQANENNYPPSGLKPITIDAEAISLLHNQGLTLDAIPAESQWVRLHQAANVSTGGVPVAALEGAHPDNLALATRAARLLHLDIAGIDLLMPDIRHSWLSSGAVICEVNAQPQLSSHLPAYLLTRLVEKNGRIPAILVLGKPANEAELETWKLSMNADGRCLGLATSQGISIGGKIVSAASGSDVLNIFQACTALLIDPAVESIMLVVEDRLFLRTGAPIDQFDLLILAGPVKSSTNESTAYPEDLAKMLAQMSTLVVVNKHCKKWMKTAHQWAATHTGLSPIKNLAPTAISSLLTQTIKRSWP